MDFTSPGQAAPTTGQRRPDKAFITLYASLRACD